jgi:IS5 family transposase
LISPGNDHDVAHAEPLLEGLDQGAVVIADKGYDAHRVRAHIKAQGARANIPNRSNRKRRYRWTKAIYRERNNVERLLQEAQAGPPHCHTLRQARSDVPRFRSARSRADLGAIN